MNSRHLSNYSCCKHCDGVECSFGCNCQLDAVREESVRNERQRLKGILASEFHDLYDGVNEDWKKFYIRIYRELVK
jgi:hypothetical protein